MRYKLSETQIADGWVLFTDKFPVRSDLQRGKYVNVMYGDGSVGIEEVNVSQKMIVGVGLSDAALIAWQKPRPLAFDLDEMYTAIPYGADGLHAVKRNTDGFIRAWDIPGEHYAKRIAEEYNQAYKINKSKLVPHEREV